MKTRLLISMYYSLSFIFVVSIFLSKTVVNCNANETRGVTDTTIKIGGMADHTGPIVSICKPIIEAFKNHARYVNDQGGIHGRKIKLIMEDDRYSIPAGIAAFKKLIFRDQVLALLGPVSVGETKALYNQIEKKRVPCIPVVPDESAIKPYRKYIFLPHDLYEDEIGVIFTYIITDLKLKNPRIALVTGDAESGKVVKAGAKKWAKYYNLDLHIEILPVMATESTSQILTMKRARINQMIVHHSIPGTAFLLKDMKRMGMNVPVYGTFPNCSEDTVKIGGKVTENYVGAHSFSSWYDTGSGAERMREITLKYHPGTEKPYRSKNYSLGWIMSEILYEGIKRAGKSLNGETLVKGLETIKDFNTKGLCGPITYTSKSHKGLDYCKLFRADPANDKLLPITDWRKPPNEE